MFINFDKKKFYDRSLSSFSYASLRSVSLSNRNNIITNSPSLISVIAGLSLQTNVRSLVEFFFISINFDHKIFKYNRPRLNRRYNLR